MFFLGVPHQVAAIAQTLNRFLTLHGYITGTPVHQRRFPSPVSQLATVSFFKTRPVNKAIGLIVDRQTSVLNYPNERRVYLDANHRDVARFSYPEDSSYVTARDALATLINEMRDRNNALGVALKHAHGIYIASGLRDDRSSFLGVQDAPEDDFTDFITLRDTDGHQRPSHRVNHTTTNSWWP